MTADSNSPPAAKRYQNETKWLTGQRQAGHQLPSAGLSGPVLKPPGAWRFARVALYWSGDHQATATAKHVGKTLSYRWSITDTGTNTKLCGQFQGPGA
ncbi:hypothetical protein [Streptomyces sp. NPDC102282]|uniref:hypothetical protein n=1 Tax=Streptomyces sp. NPDC102282 TaxID=3366154 RepID=UPI00381F59E3